MQRLQLLPVQATIPTIAGTIDFQAIDVNGIFQQVQIAATDKAKKKPL